MSTGQTTPSETSGASSAGSPSGNSSPSDTLNSGQSAQPTERHVYLDIQAAEALRMMADNQQDLSYRRRKGKRFDNFQERIGAALQERNLGLAPGSLFPPQPFGEDEDVDISLHSPRTVNNYYQSPDKPTSQTTTASSTSAPSLASKLAPWLIGAGLLGAGAGIPAIWQALTKTAAATAPAEAVWNLGLLPPVEK